VALATPAVAAEEYPTRQIEYVVPAGAGGGTDAIARVVADMIGKKFGQPVMVVNKPGGGGVIGSSYVMKQQKADGYTVLADVHSFSSMLVGGMVNPPVTLEDRIFIARLVVNPIVFAVKADAPWKDFREFSQWVKANPEKLTWGSVGPSGLSAFGIQDWLAVIGADHTRTRMVPTKGAADSLTKLAGGHIVLACHTVAECYALHKAGKIRVLATQSPKRTKYLPEVPTAGEQGVKGLTVIWWTGITMRKGTPDYVVKKWEKAVGEMVKDPQFEKRMDLIQSNINYLDSKDFKKFIYNEAKYYTELAKRIGIRR
jgi:tripartite-type tricarboxylate transporter receptor subunit TctC